MAKNIIFCADGTWNKPLEEIDQDTESPSNVFKLFNLLAGKQGDNIRINMATGRISEYEKSYIADTKTVQIAKYINGVGNSSVKMNRILGGAFGFGLIERMPGAIRLFPGITLKATRFSSLALAAAPIPPGHWLASSLTKVCWLENSIRAKPNLTIWQCAPGTVIARVFNKPRTKTTF